MTREEFIAQHGFDPTPIAVPEDHGGVVDHLKSAAVGALSIPTDFIALGGTIGSAIKGGVNSYINDTPFLEEFNKNQQIEGADKNTQAHLDNVVATWLRDNPNLTDEQVKVGRDNYMKSKHFEDFMQTQLMPGQRLTSAWKDTIRGYLGDERPDSERSWTEGAAEAVGGALVPGPTGWAAKVGTAAAKRGAVTNAIFNNPVSKGALKTAEVLTPLTMPYTPGNVALNAVAGVGIDQAARVAMGNRNAFTQPANQQDDAGMGVLSGWVASIGAMGVVLGAMRHRTSTTLAAVKKPSDTADVINSPNRMVETQEAIADPVIPGQASMVAGDPQQLDMPSYLDTEVGQATATIRRFGDRNIDRGIAYDTTLKDFQSRELVDALERDRTTYAGSILNDTMTQAANVALAPVQSAYRALSPEDAQAAQHAITLSSSLARRDMVARHYTDQINEIGRKLAQSSISTAQRTDLTAKQNNLVGDLRRLMADDEDARLDLPTIPYQQRQRVDNTFQSDTKPQMVAFREAYAKWADGELQARVKQELISQTEANIMRAQNKYYLPATSDPLNGLQGWQRFRQSAVEKVKNAQQMLSRGTQGTILREGPMENFDRVIPPKPIPGAPKAPETRMTTPLDMFATMKLYTLKNRLEIAHTRVRNGYIRAAAFIDGLETKGFTDFYKKGYIRMEKVLGRHWNDASNFKHEDVQALLKNEDVVVEWSKGTFRLWRYGDTEFSRMLRQEPIILSTMMKAVVRSSNTFKQLTTGYLNPFFAPKGAFYNTVVGIATRSDERIFGYVTKAMHQFLPEVIAKRIGGMVPDITAPLGLPWHMGAAMVETWLKHSTRVFAERLAADNSVFQTFRNVVGDAAYNRMTAHVLRIANKADLMTTNHMTSKGVSPTAANMDHITTVRDATNVPVEMVPNVIRGAWAFYKDLVNAIYIAPQRMFYSQNHAHLMRKFKGNIPEAELEKLMHETRTLGGNMSKIGSGEVARTVEAFFPFATQTKLGAYHLIRHMGDPQAMSYMIPRLALMTYGVGQSFYWMTTWNKESSDYLWKQTPEHDRYRYVYVPTMPLLYAWATGENPAFKRDLFYKVIIPPDLVGIVAGTAAMMQYMGMIPASATPTPMVNDYPAVIGKSLIPAMPPLLQGLAGLGGLKLDPQSADTRGGNIFRSFNQNFKSGPQSEAAGNLGEISSTTALVMNGLFGAMGANLTAAADVFLHASKYSDKTTPEGRLLPLPQPDFIRGLEKATTSVWENASANKLDIPIVTPLLWQSKDTMSAMTPDWSYMAENLQHIQSIVGSKDEAMSQGSQQYRDITRMTGGMGRQSVVNPVLLEMADLVAAWQAPSGELGRMKASYSALSKTNQGIKANYNKTQEWRREESNKYITAMQANIRQQHLATKYLEQLLQDKYGPMIPQLTKGRGITMETLDHMLREQVGAGSNEGASAATN